MLLAIDVGNTNLSLAVFEGQGADADVVLRRRMRTDARLTSDEIALTVNGLLGRHAERITGISALSTVPSVLREMRMMLDRYWRDLPQVVVAPGVRTGVPLQVDNPKEVGADRVMNALAAHHLFACPTIVVDFGTSTRVDVVTGDGEFLGGAIAPGIDISVDALTAAGAALRKVELVRPRSVIGKSTVECLQSGVIFGFAGQVDGLVRRVQRELPEFDSDDVAVVATGGLASLVIDECETITDHEPDLTVTGLRLVFERNQAGTRAGRRNVRG
ncbi:type III pantothenate kinase [Tomitella biformata]|uniref:type III pantothenate kinase n=1 Tax=Tomitella biformata TaxID=630403 RepID=UPI00046380EC|nr:type III pantothenate kinase [Tomitella biformata]